MSFSIKKRIYLSFLLLVGLFSLCAIIFIIILNKNLILSKRISNVTSPSLNSLYDVRKMIFESKMYSTNWVYFRTELDDKIKLQIIQNIDYPLLKTRFNKLSEKWEIKSMRDSLQQIFKDFDYLMLTEKKIMASLNNFEDYHDLVIKFEAERVVEDELLPQTSSLLNKLGKLIEQERLLLTNENITLEESNIFLKQFITSLIVFTSVLGILLSIYMSRIILNPFHKIKEIINDMGKGITRKLNYTKKGNEIAEMADSINHLSEKLETASMFASEIGKRNFNASFEVLSEHDTLGKALLIMRDNLKSGDEKINIAQHIARLGNWERDLTTNKMVISDEIFKIMDVDPSTFSGDRKDALKYIHPDDVVYAMKTSAKCILDHQPFSYECRFITTSGITKNAIINGEAIINKQGQVSGLFGTLQDITDQKKAQIALANAHNQLKLLFENIHEAFYSLDAIENKFLQVSEGCERLYGYTVKEFYKDANLWRDVIVKEDLEIVNATYPDLLAGKTVEHEHRIIHKNGEIRWLHAKVTPTLNENNEIVRIDGIAYDVTERRKAEEALKENISQLMKSNSELDNFVYSVSHDLRAPLTSMLGIVEIAKEDSNEPIQLEHLAMLKQSITRLDGFIGDILDYSKNSRTELIKTKIDFNELLVEVKNNLKFINGSKQKTEIKINVINKIAFYSDKTRISIILNNLISNALRYQNPNEKKQFVSILIKTSTKEAIINISDNGVGINKEYQQKVFDMFYRVSENSIGSGLGLYIVRETVDRLQGQINLESEPGKGSTFKIIIPNQKQKS